MSYIVGFEILETSDMSAARVYRTMNCTKNTIVEQAVAGIVLHNPSAFTGLKMKIYSDNGGAPGKLIATSINSWDKTALLTTYNYGVRWPYFNFDSVVLRKNLDYHFVINGAANYTADPDTTAGNSYIGWRIGYPDPVYDDLAYTDQIRWYFDLAFMGKRL